MRKCQPTFTCFYAVQGCAAISRHRNQATPLPNRDAVAAYRVSRPLRSFRSASVVAINYRQRADEAAAVAEAIKKRAGRAEVFPADVSRGPANAVAPGLVDTDMGKPLIEAGVANRIPIGRAGTAEEIAHAVVFIVGNSYLTGQTIPVNGGTLFS